MKKFNEFESYLIQEALANHMKYLEDWVAEVDAEKEGRCIYAQGYFTMVVTELIDKVSKEMTRKQK